MDLNLKSLRGSLFLFFLPLFLFISTSLIFSNCARKKEKEKNQLVIIKDEFEKVEEFVLDEKTGQELAKNQILIYIVGNSKSELEEKKAKVSEFLKSKKGEFSVLGEIEFLSKKEKVGVLLQAKVPAGIPEEIKQIVSELRNFDGSIRAFPNMRMRPNAVLDGRIPLDPLFDSWEETPGGNNWHFEAVNMPGLWKMETEGKVPVAVIEFGIRKHEDLEYDLRRGVDGEGADWAQNHGVSVLGVLGAVGNNSKGIAGTIWRGDIRAYLIDGTLSSLIQSIVFALEDEAKVILFAGGLEWGSVNPEGNPEAEEILEYHREIFSVVFQYIRYYDGLFVQSAGNEGRDARYAGVGASVKDLFPHNILLVGSTNILGKISSFSNRGSLVDIYLPGESIFTTCWGSSNDTGYCLRSGTSYSAAMGAGVAVLLGSINGDLRSGEIKEMILRGVRMEGEGENARYVIDFSISGDLAILSRSGNLDLGVRIPELGDIVPMPWMPVEREAVVEIGNLGPKAVECAVYDDTTVDGDPAYKAPKCPDNVEGCSSCGLLDGNGNVSGYPEPNQPNTLYGLVQDLPGTGAYAPVRTISIQVDSMAESGFIQSGPTATDRRNIKVTVRAWGNNPDQWIDVFYTSDANANPPIFELLGSYRYDCGASEGWEAPVVPGTVTCSRSGNETTISFLMTLP
ncbi:MAG: S8 family peptidase, partial [Candidatus Calescibacterium sp.]